MADCLMLERSSKAACDREPTVIRPFEERRAEENVSPHHASGRDNEPSFRIIVAES